MLAFTIYQAYKYERQKYLPQTIESIDLKETYDDILINLEKNVKDSRKVLREAYEEVQRRLDQRIIILDSEN